MFKRKNEFEKKSYSQSGEDVIVKYIFDCIGKQNPSYLDIGAHHPYYLSNSALFYENGSRGVNVEPDPELFSAFQKNRREDVNLNIGISDIECEADFYIMSRPTLNTFSKSDANEAGKEGNYSIKKTVKIPVSTIQKVIDNYCGGKCPDYITIDAEGRDEAMIQGMDFNLNFPTVICVETLSFSTSGRGLKNLTLIDFIVEKGYLMYADTNINSIFVRRDVWEK